MSEDFPLCSRSSSRSRAAPWPRRCARARRWPSTWVSSTSGPTTSSRWTSSPSGRAIKLELFKAKGSFNGQVCAAADLQDDLGDGHEQGAGGPGGPGPQAAAAGHRDGAQVRGGGDDQPGQYYYSHLQFLSSTV